MQRKILAIVAAAKPTALVEYHVQKTDYACDWDSRVEVEGRTLEGEVRLLDLIVVARSDGDRTKLRYESANIRRAIRNLIERELLKFRTVAVWWHGSLNPSRIYCLLSLTDSGRAYVNARPVDGTAHSLSHGGP